MPSSAAPIPFAAGANVGGKRNNWWYSFNVGPAHIISLNSGVVTAPTEVTNTSRYKWDYPVEVQREQYTWLKQDLIAASANRSECPWIFVYAHYPLYCSSSSADCKLQADQMRNGIDGHWDVAWEPLLQEHSVDMYVSAHMHSYERFLPVYNGSSLPRWRNTPNIIRNADAPVHVVTGAAGNVEGQEGFSAIFGFSAFRSMDYGYNRMEIYNATHLQWSFVVTDNATDAGTVIDDMWLIKESGETALASVV